MVNNLIETIIISAAAAIVVGAWKRDYESNLFAVLPPGLWWMRLVTKVSQLPTAHRHHPRYSWSPFYLLATPGAVITHLFGKLLARFCFIELNGHSVRRCYTAVRKFKRDSVYLRSDHATSIIYILIKSPETFSDTRAEKITIEDQILLLKLNSGTLKNVLNSWK